MPGQQRKAVLRKYTSIDKTETNSVESKKSDENPITSEEQNELHKDLNDEPDD